MILFQPPPPLVKVLKGNKMADTTRASDDASRKKTVAARRPIRGMKGKENRGTVEIDESKEVLVIHSFHKLLRITVPLLFLIYNVCMVCLTVKFTRWHEYGETIRHSQRIRTVSGKVQVW